MRILEMFIDWCRCLIRWRENGGADVLDKNGVILMSTKIIDYFTAL